MATRQKSPAQKSSTESGIPSEASSLRALSAVSMISSCVLVRKCCISVLRVVHQSPTLLTLLVQLVLSMLLSSRIARGVISSLWLPIAQTSFPSLKMRAIPFATGCLFLWSMYYSRMWLNRIRRVL